MPGYKHPCRYCNGLVEADDNVCPLCGKVNPTGPLRCQRCRSPVSVGWKRCSNCGLELEVACPHCGQPTFLGDYCDKCGQRLATECPHCHAEQTLAAEKCTKCGKPMPARKG